MGFQVADLESLIWRVHDSPGVTGIWQHAPTDHEATLWVVVQGFDDEAHKRRLQVWELYQAFLTHHRSEMVEGGFVLTFHVVVSDEDLGPPQIPEIAERIAA